MNKAILVLNIPRSCMECSLRFRDDHSDFCGVNINDNQLEVHEFMLKFTKPDSCPLKPIPEKYEIDDTIPHDRDCDWEYEYGYNKAIDDILELEVKVC